MKLRSGVFAFLAFLLPALAQASPVALAVCANDVCQDLSSLMTTNGEVSSIDTTVNVGGIGIVDLVGTFDADPFITFAATTTNLQPGATTFAFLFGTPVTPGFYNSATATGSVTFTGVVGAGDATLTTSAIYPTYLSGYGTLGLVPTNLGVDLGTATCTSSNGVATTCNQGSTSATFPMTFFDGLEALVTYTQTGNGSVASWSGTVTLDVTDVPEPGTITLLGLGVAGLAARRRR